MSNYFYDMIPAEEFAQLKFCPTIPEFLTWIEEKWADQPAVSNTVDTYTYKEMCSHIARKRSLLNSLGLEKGDKVAILERNSIEAIEMYLAVTSAGYVAINLPVQLPQQAVIGCCMKFGVKVLALRPEFASFGEGAPCKVISTTDMAGTEAPVAVVSKDDPATIFFTGGTTGAPKGAILPHRAIMRGSWNGIFSPGEKFCGHRYICMLPLSHVFGLIRSTMSVFYIGAEWFSCEDMKATFGKLATIKPTTLVLVPGICDILMGMAKMYGTGFLGGELKQIIAGAATVPPRLIAEFDKLGIELLEGYGMTEGANFTAGNKDVATHPSSVGQIYPEQEAKIVNGELWYRGDNVFLGYYGDPQKTAETLTEDGWLKTGDLARFDEDGYLYITGRIKNLIILPNGENVSPEEIEEFFYKDPCVKDALVKEDVVNGVPAIAIEILPQLPAFAGKGKEDIENYMSELVRKVNDQLPTTHRISKMTVREEDFKRTGSLKVSRL